MLIMKNSGQDDLAFSVLQMDSGVCFLVHPAGGKQNCLKK